MSDPAQLSKRERQIMDVVWANGQATATMVMEQLPDPPVRAAVRTMLRILEHKGYLAHQTRGREFVYRPTQPRGQAARSALGRVLDVFFGGSLEKAVAAHLSDRRRGKRASAEELQRLAELIEEAKQKGV